MNLPETPPRTTPITDKPGLAARAADLLRTPNTMLPLSAEEAACVVAQMLLVHYPPRATVLREGDHTRANFLLLLLEGDVSVDTGLQGAGVAIGVVGPGSIIGEMALLDGAPRSATCVAVSAVQAAGLSRQGLAQLIDEHPKVAAKLLIGLATRISDRLRAMADQLHLYGQLTATLQAELERQRGASA
jgi:CRP/FNR family transcriptional regulator, cyclic AMP receptor protein